MCSHAAALLNTEKALELAFRLAADDIQVKGICMCVLFGHNTFSAHRHRNCVHSYNPMC